MGEPPAGGLGLFGGDLATTDGETIFLPERVEVYPSKAENFAQYKVLATHQAGRLEFGTFELRAVALGGDAASARDEGETAGLGQTPGLPLPDRPARGDDGQTPGLPLRERLVGRGEPGVRPPSTVLAFQRFFDAFAERRLAKDLFEAVEGARIDAHVLRSYRGLRATYERARARALALRPSPAHLPRRRGAVEALVQFGLGGDPLLPDDQQDFVARARAVLHTVTAPGARVEASARATIRLYALIQRLPLPEAPIESTESTALVGEAESDLAELLAALAVAEATGAHPQAGTRAGADDPYASPEAVDFRGDLKPELVEAMMRLREGATERPGGGAPLSPAELRALLERGEEIEISGLSEGEVDAALGLFVSNLLGNYAGAPKLERQNDAGQSGETVIVPEPDTPGRWFTYDEWDFRAEDYRPDWCRLNEQVVVAGSPDYFDGVLAENSTLAAELRRQFEWLKPEELRKVRRLPDGEDVDLDAAIESRVERRAGVSPTGFVYWRRQKLERQVAVALLLDLSASTDEEIEPPRATTADGGRTTADGGRRTEDGQPRMEAFGPQRIAPSGAQPPAPSAQHSALSAQRPAPSAQRPAPSPQPPLRPPSVRSRGKRIIDVTKESVVLLTDAIEALGDAYGIYGFSGYGRSNVDYFVVKEFDQPFSIHVAGRIGALTPLRSTRMGTAIRHSVTKLAAQPARQRLLLLLSDGYPQDSDYYGRDRSEKDYALHDTRMALVEARRHGITPFCLTVDKAGHDYLREMCGDFGYEVVNAIESLPKRLADLYRRLTL